MLDQRGQLLRTAVGFATCTMPSYDRALWMLRTWLDSWTGIGHVAAGMHGLGYDLQLTQYDERGWRATFYTTGMEHSPTSATGRVGAHAVARDAAGGVGGDGEGRGGQPMIRVLLRIGSRRWTGYLLIVLALSSLGCARGDWTSQTLTLVDVTGTWEGPYRFSLGGTGFERTTRWVLQQTGAKVRGEVQGPDGAPLGSVEGLVNGEAFNWKMTAIKLQWMNAPSRSYRGEAIVNSDELNGRADGMGCPCTFILRRVSTDAIKEKKAQ